MQEYINGKILFRETFEKKDFLIDNGKIYFSYQKTQNPIDLEGKVVTPGLVDIHVHSRIPGQEYKEDLEHLERAAIAGGVTRIVTMANVLPAPFDAETWKYINSLYEDSHLFFLPAARSTFKGEPVNFKSFKSLVNIFSDDGWPISGDHLMRKVLLSAKETNSIIMLHEEDESLPGNAYHSNFARNEGIKTFGHEYESNIIKRDININRSINAKIHFQHLSTKKSVELFENALKEGITVSAEVTPHHLYFENEMLENHGNFRMNPPIGNLEDREALRDAFKRGVLRIIATDHAPHSEQEKNCVYVNSLNGIIGLETALPLSIMSLGIDQLENILRALTYNPADYIGIDIDFVDGSIANLAIIDPYKKWVYEAKNIKSKSHNSPIIDRELQGKVETVLIGKRAWRNE